MFNYDTVNFRLDGAEVKTPELVNSVAQYLDANSIKERRTIANGYVEIFGRLGNLCVSATNWQLRIYGGSLCKWYHGNNVQAMTRTDVKNAVERLSDELHQPITCARVSRLDIGINVFTDYPPKVYMNYFGPLRYSERKEFDNGLCYPRRDWRLCVYDKIQEQRKNAKIPIGLEAKNLMRIELQQQRRLGNIRGAMLFQERFYHNEKKLLRRRYMEVQKQQEMKRPKNAPRTPKEMLEYFTLAFMAENGGTNKALALVQEWRLRGELDKMQAYRMRDAIKKISLGAGTETSTYISELDEKINELTNF